MTIPGYPPNDSPGSRAAVSIRRFVNEEIAQTGTRFDTEDGLQFDFLCECGDLSCVGLVTMTIAAFRASEPGSVVVDHQDADERR